MAQRQPNREIVLYASAARTATTATEELKVIDNDSWSYGTFFINATASSATPSVVFTVQAIDEMGTAYDILASAAVTGISKTVLTVGPGCAVTANVSANTTLPARFRLLATAGDADSLTYSARVHLTGA